MKSKSSNKRKSHISTVKVCFVVENYAFYFIWWQNLTTNVQKLKVCFPIIDNDIYNSILLGPLWNYKSYLNYGKYSNQEFQKRFQLPNRLRQLTHGDPAKIWKIYIKDRNYLKYILNSCLGYICNFVEVCIYFPLNQIV